MPVHLVVRDLATVAECLVNTTREALPSSICPRVGGDGDLAAATLDVDASASRLVPLVPMGGTLTADPPVESSRPSASIGA